MHHKETPGGGDDVLFTLAETQNFLRISRSATFELLRTGAVPYIRQQSRRYCWRSDLVKYLNSHRIATDAA